jgi:hypothetical protein
MSFLLAAALAAAAPIARSRACARAVAHRDHRANAKCSALIAT